MKMILSFKSVNILKSLWLITLLVDTYFVGRGHYWGLCQELTENHQVFMTFQVRQGKNQLLTSNNALACLVVSVVPVPANFVLSHHVFFYLGIY